MTLAPINANLTLMPGRSMEIPLATTHCLYGIRVSLTRSITADAEVSEMPNARVVLLGGAQTAGVTAARYS
jgi:hypothetical protein